MINDCIFIIFCGFVDFVVGVYWFGNVVVLRMRLVIFIEFKIFFNENLVLLNLFGLLCVC